MAKLKPQNFDGMTGIKITISQVPGMLIESIRSRTDLSVDLSNYLVKLVQYCENSTSVRTNELSSLYRNLEVTEKSAIQKDFSELLGPIIISNESKQTLQSLGLTISGQSKMFIPVAGNYPLVDFMIYTGKTEDQYSVKTLQKTTNTLKAGDILKTVDDSVKRKHPEEVKILELIDSNDAKLGPILILSKIASKIPEFKKTNKMYRKFSSLRSIDNNLLSENPEDWYSLFGPIADTYYSRGKSTFDKAWKKQYYYDALTVLAQYTVADFTQDMNWMPFVDDIQTKVNYFKFGLNANGTYSYEIVNGLSERKPNQKFRLRAKSRLKEGAESTRSGQDKLGIQP